MWGLPQAGILGNKLLKKCLAPHRYFKYKQIPGPWKHATCPISFTLVVNNYGVKYMHQEDINHLIKCIKEKYELTKDWDGNLVGTLKDRYVRNVPLPRAPWIQSANHMTSNEQAVMDSQDTCYLQVPIVPKWSDLTRSLTGVRRNVFPFCLLG
jgi:hypothetical protein